MNVYETRRREITPSSRVYVEPLYNTIGVSLLKEWLKWHDSDNSEDRVMNACLVGAIKQAESYTRRVIERATWRTYLCGFCFVTVDILPIDLTTLVVKYFDENNDLQTLNQSLFIVYDNGPDKEVNVEFTGTLPELFNKRENVYLEYVAGYTNYPEDLTSAILKHTADSFEVRTDQVNGSMSEVQFNFHQALFPYKILS